MTELISVMLIGHFLADYYFQNEEMAMKKREEPIHLAFHCLVHMVVMGFLLYPILPTYWITAAVACGGAHLIVDGVKFALDRGISSKRSNKALRLLRNWERAGAIYSVDQVIHIAFLLVFSNWLVEEYHVLSYWLFPFTSYEVSLDILKYVLALLLILKPTNITFRKLFGQNKPASDDIFVKDRNAGQLIGNMERLLMLVMLGMGQYTAIGLVFTAKSVTRYNRIAEEPAFAEYYLMGTLFSILSVVAVHLGVTAL